MRMLAEVLFTYCVTTVSRFHPLAVRLGAVIFN